MLLIPLCIGCIALGAALDLTPVINNPNLINLEPGSLIQAKEGEAAGGIKASCATEIQEIVEATAERGFDPLLDP